MPLWKTRKKRTASVRSAPPAIKTAAWLRISESKISFVDELHQQVDAPKVPAQAAAPVVLVTTPPGEQRGSASETEQASSSFSEEVVALPAAAAPASTSQQHGLINEMMLYNFGVDAGSPRPDVRPGTPPPRRAPPFYGDGSCVQHMAMTAARSPSAPWVVAAAAAAGLWLESKGERTWVDRGEELALTPPDSPETPGGGPSPREDEQVRGAVDECHRLPSTAILTAI